jgi:hypothetical protein
MTALLPRGPTIRIPATGSRLALRIAAAGAGAMALNSIFNGRSVASTADGIPLDSFTPAGAQTVVALFALFGLARLMLTLVGLVVLLRYRALVPFLFALLLLEHLCRYLILRWIPIPAPARPGIRDKPRHPRGDPPRPGALAVEPALTGGIGRRRCVPAAPPHCRSAALPISLP